MGQPYPRLDELQSYLANVETSRLQMFEAMVSADKPPTDQELQKLALFGAAISSIKDAIAWWIKQDEL